MMRYAFTMMAAFSAIALASCSGGGGNEAGSPDFSGYPDTPFTIHKESELIGGPLAQGAIGDVLLANDRIRVIIQKPRKNAGVNSFGGNIIDADLMRQGGGQDNFGSLFPLVNIEWTVNPTTYEVIADGKDGGPKVLRTKGKIDVYEYLDLDFIGDVAQGVAGQKISFSNRFDDRRNPFEIYDDLSGMSWDVVTDYTLEPGKNFVRIDTTFSNGGEKEARFPVGMFLNGSGQNSMLIPGVGFSPDLMTQVGANTPAVIYAAFDGVDVSYGYFFDAGQFTDPETDEPYQTTSVTYSGVTGLLLGEEFLKLAPLGGGGSPEIHFSVPPGGTRTVTGFFVIGDGSAGSVMDAGLAAIGAKTRPISGTVKTAEGKPYPGATVAVLSKGATVVTYRTDAQGRFQGQLPTGGNEASKRFGNGRYTVLVDVPGYHANGKAEAGACTPSEIDLMTQELVRVECVLGESGEVAIAGPAIDAETERPIPVRLTISGEDPSPNKVGSAGRFTSTTERNQPFGIVDVRYLTAKGTVDLSGSSSFPLEPGRYLFVVSHGPEYTADARVVEVAAGKTATIDKIRLSRAVPTPGLIGADLHIHSIKSPDSTLPQEMRVLSAAAEGLDVLQSSDHDFVVDYGPVASKLMGDGVISPGSLQTAAGNEITPNHYGHLHAFPLTPDPGDPEGGAVDWSDSDREEVSPAPDYVWTLDELIALVRKDPMRPVIQINHLMDMPTGLVLACGWVTSPFYLKDFGIEPMSSYADPVERRMPPRSGGANFPIPFGESGLSTIDFDALELVIGWEMNDAGLLYRSSLPTWFNLLNLGMIATATADSDSHQIIPVPVGLPRNYIASSIDPRDKKGQDHSAIDLGEYAQNVKGHRVTVSGGVIVSMRAVAESGSSAEIGGTIGGRKVAFTVEARAPSWAWFDTIEVFANTEPIPVDDETGEPMQGTAADPAEFYKPYHLPRYGMEPVKAFRLSDGTLESWKEEGGAITATVTFELNVLEDTWVVAAARGSKSTKGYRSLFPIVTHATASDQQPPEAFDPADLASLHADARIGAAAWGFTNPIFIDADGGGFMAKYVREGISPLSKKGAEGNADTAVK